MLLSLFKKYFEMESIKKFFSKITGNVIWYNLILAVSGVVVFLFLVFFLLKVFTRHGQYKVVPDFSGMTLQEAEKASKKARLKLDVIDSVYMPAFEGGVILEQLPKPNDEVKSGRRILLTVNSHNQKVVKVPFVTGYSLRQAKNNLEVVGLEIDRLIFRDDIATNYVLEQQFEGKIVTKTSNIEAEQGSGVVLIVGVSEDDRVSQVPKLVGFSMREAKSRLWEMGLNVGKIEFDEDITPLTQNDAKVYFQSPSQSMRVAYGTEVSFRLSLDEERVSDGSSKSDKEARTIIQRQQKEDEEAKALEQEESAELEGEGGGFFD